MVAVDHDLAARHADVDAHIELFALVMMFVRHFNYYPAGHDVIEEFVELARLVTDVCFQRL